MLIVDAWFDVILESHGNELRTALVEALVFELPTAVICFWIAFRTERFVTRAIRSLHLAPAGEGPAESDLVGVLQVATDGEPAREPGDADASA
jgi:hypothetical protein